MYSVGLHTPTLRDLFAFLRGVGISCAPSPSERASVRTRGLPPGASFIATASVPEKTREGRARQLACRPHMELPRALRSTLARTWARRVTTTDEFAFIRRTKRRLDRRHDSASLPRAQAEILRSSTRPSNRFSTGQPAWHCQATRIRSDACTAADTVVCRNDGCSTVHIARVLWAGEQIPRSGKCGSSGSSTGRTPVQNSSRFSWCQPSDNIRGAGMREENNLKK